MIDNLDISGIVELGTGFGALTTFLGLWGIVRNVEVLSIDHENKHNKDIFDYLDIVYLQMDEFSEQLRKKVFTFINSLKGPVLFICDGGDKVKEFNFWAPLLLPGSIIAVHDWTVEINYSDIKDTVRKYCIPYDQDRWNKMNVQFAMFKVIKPYLSIVTRNHPNRVKLLKRCKESVSNLKDKGFQHVIIQDASKVGIAEANEMFFENKHLVTGKYVFILDDDDVLISGDLVSDIREIAEKRDDPEIIFIRSILKDISYPLSESWEKDTLVPGSIGSSCFVMLNSLWQENIEYFSTSETPGDFNFINAAFSKNPSIFWQGKVYSRAEKLRRGRAKDE